MEAKTNEGSSTGVEAIGSTLTLKDYRKYFSDKVSDDLSTTATATATTITTTPPPHLPVFVKTIPHSSS